LQRRQRDSHPHDAVVPGLPAPPMAAREPPGRRQGYASGLGQLGIGHAAGAVADRKRDVRCHRPPLIPAGLLAEETGLDHWSGGQGEKPPVAADTTVANSGELSPRGAPQHRRLSTSAGRAPSRGGDGGSDGSRIAGETTPRG